MLKDKFGQIVNEMNMLKILLKFREKFGQMSVVNIHSKIFMFREISVLKDKFGQNINEMNMLKILSKFRKILPNIHSQSFLSLSFIWNKYNFQF